VCVTDHNLWTNDTLVTTRYRLRLTRWLRKGYGANDATVSFHCGGVGTVFADELPCVPQLRMSSHAAGGPATQKARPQMTLRSTVYPTSTTAAASSQDVGRTGAKYPRIPAGRRSRGPPVS
jgi:hypothetical protein